MRLSVVFLSLFFIGMLPQPVNGDSPPDVYSSIFWEISGPPYKITWIEIHNIQEAKSTGIAYIEVLARRKSSPAWDFRHICPFMAITTEALKRSVQHPIKVKSVYPETYESGFNQWKLASKNGSPVICTTSIENYLKQHPTDSLLNSGTR